MEEISALPEQGKGVVMNTCPLVVCHKIKKIGSFAKPDNFC